jgi:hypothetical protein
MLEDKEFVSKEVAKALLDIGFNEPTFKAYYKDGDVLLAIGTGNMFDTRAPLYQQAYFFIKNKWKEVEGYEMTWNFDKNDAMYLEYIKILKKNGNF